MFSGVSDWQPGGSCCNLIIVSLDTGYSAEWAPGSIFTHQQEKILLNVSHCIPFSPRTNILERKYSTDDCPWPLPFNTPVSHGESDPGVVEGWSPGDDVEDVDDVDDEADRVMQARLDTIDWAGVGWLQESSKA